MSFKMVDPEKISMGTINPRTDLGDITDLIGSMRERQGSGQRAVVLPLLVKKLEGDEIHAWEIVDGKRRLQSALALRLPEVPVIDETDTESVAELLVMSLLTDVYMKKEFHWIERGTGYRKLHDEFGMTYKDIGKKVGLSESRIFNYVTTLNRLEQSTTELSPAKVLDMSTIEEIVNKCPEDDIPELIEYAVTKDIPRDDMRKVLFALRNFDASQTVVKDFQEVLYKELQERYHPHRFNPKFMALCMHAEKYLG